MKIICEAKIVHRGPQPVSEFKSSKLKSTLAIGHYPPNKENSDIVLMVFSSANKNGLRYKIKNNIEKVFLKFVNDGKCTLSFCIPSHDVQITCDPVQLKCFLRVIKLVLCDKKAELNKIGLSKLISAKSAISKLPKPSPSQKVVIKSQSEIRTALFPKVHELQMKSLKLLFFPQEILMCEYLSLLNLSENSIFYLPKELGELKLSEFILADNKLSNEPKNWEWLKGKRMRKSLKLLDISSNQVIFIITISNEIIL